MKLYGLIGFPLTHSFSKKYFDNKFQSEQITNCTFSNFEIAEINSITSLIQQNPALQGFAITIPYKQKILPYLCFQSPDVSQMLACNCVKIKEGKLYGYNTDIIGFEKSFCELLKPNHNKALVLGTGGAAQAVIFVLKKIGIHYQTVSRNEINNAITYDELTEELLNNFSVIINTTPLGTFPNVSDFPAIPYEYLTPEHYLFDLVYNPSETTFLSKGKTKGCTIKNGYDMLTIQAEENWKIWQSEEVQ